MSNHHPEFCSNIQALVDSLVGNMSPLMHLKNKKHWIWMNSSTFRGFLLWIGASTKQQAQQFMISIPRRDVDRIDLRAACTDGNIHDTVLGRPIRSMGLVYSPDPWMVDFDGTCIGKYTSPMDPMGVEGCCGHGWCPLQTP